MSPKGHYDVDVVGTEADTRPVIGPTPDSGAVVRAGVPRLARHTIELGDGHRVSLAVCGRGVPLVVVHGFSAEGILYAQTLSRLVSMGFKVIAIDAAGHGATQGLPTGGASLESYTRLLGRVLDDLGVQRAVLVGHSMGGRLVTELAASEPERALGVVLLDAIVGDTWDRMVYAFRLNPLLLGGIAGVLAVDTLTTVPVFRDPGQAVKLGKLVAPTLAGHALRPWRMIGPAVSILRSRSSRWMLDAIKRLDIPLVVVHGDRDVAVPLATARDSARRGGGQLVVVHRASHSWLLKDPQTLPAVFAALLAGPFGQRACYDPVAAEGLDPAVAGVDDIEALFFDPGALVVELTPPWREPAAVRFHVNPRYEFTVQDPAEQQPASR